MTRLLLVLGALATLASQTCAEEPVAPARPMHPPVIPLDFEGRPIVQTHQPISTMRTCGSCHDTAFIAGHSYHADAGFSRPFAAGKAPSGRPWDIGTGLFGRWNAMANGPSGPVVDLKHWLATMGSRHIGGGPADALGVEMDCFLCHIPAPDHAARTRELRDGRYRWASTATLASTGLTRRTDAGWAWDPKAFAPDGSWAEGVPRPRVTSARNCGVCHGQVQEDATPVVFTSGPGSWSTEAKGQVFSPQLLSRSGLNLENKDALSRPFDIHAERVLQCSDCHAPINNPTQFSGVARTAPRHLNFEPRRLTPGEYLARPNHQFAKGHTPQGTVARELDGTMRRCEQCHNAVTTHDWLPYPRRHFQAMNCEACHIPRVYAPAREMTDWTVVRLDSAAATLHRGAEGDPADPATLLHGFQPVLLPREELDGSRKLTPHNLVTTWYWVGGEPTAPVSTELLTKAFLEGDDYDPTIKMWLDVDGDGRLGNLELRLDTKAKVDAVAARLEAVGVKSPRIRGEIQPYSLHHGVATGNWAVRDCGECHGEESRVSMPIELAAYVPGGVLPEMIGDANVRWDGRMSLDVAGRLTYEPVTAPERIYVIGRDRWGAGDLLGALALVGSVLAVGVHGGLRVRSTRKAR